MVNPCKSTHGLMVQCRSGEGVLEAEAEKKSNIQLRKTFKEIKQKAQQVSVQRRRAEVFRATYGPWWQFKQHASAPIDRVVSFLGLRELYRVRVISSV